VGRGRVRSAVAPQGPGTDLAPREGPRAPLAARRYPTAHPGEAMGFEVSKQGDVTVIAVEGQLIVGNRQELKQKVLEELEADARKFLIDFSNTGYIDSSGLGVLVSLSKKIREQGGELRLARLNEDLRTLFELTKLDTLFHIADDRDEALASF
jgi:anti-sigma B factor antagonist